jgi:hypothetical protein
MRRKSGKGVDTRKGAVCSTPIGRDERSKRIFEREEFDAGAFWDLDTNISLEGNHGVEEGERKDVEETKKAIQRTVIRASL